MFPYQFDYYAPVIEELPQEISEIVVLLRYLVFDVAQPEMGYSVKIINQETGKSFHAEHSVIESTEEKNRIAFIAVKMPELVAGEYLLYIFAEDKISHAGSYVNTIFKIR